MKPQRLKMVKFSLVLFEVCFVVENLKEIICAVIRMKYNRNYGSVNVRRSVLFILTIFSYFDDCLIN